MFDSIQQVTSTNRRRLGVVLFSFFALCIVAVSLAFFSLSIGTPYMGIVLSMHDKGWIVESVDVNGAARHAGIRQGDTPVEINGQPAQAFLGKHERAGVVFSFSMRELTVTDELGQLKSASLKNSSPSWQSLIEQTAWLVVSLIFWITGFYVFFKRPRNIAALLLALCGLVFGLALSANLAAERGVPTSAELNVAASVLGPWLLFHFFLILTDERTWIRSSPLVYLIYLPPAITLLLLPLVGWAEGQPVGWFRTVRLSEYAVGFLAAASVAVLNYFRAASPRTRHQVKIVLFACLAALVPFLVLYIIPETIWREPVLPSGFAVLLIAFIPLGMGYAVVTQKLMDIDVIIRRTIIYGAITVVMTAILSTVTFSVMAFQRSAGTGVQVLVALAAGGVATALFGPTKKGIEILVDRLFYKDRYDYRKIISGLSTSLNLMKDLTEISRLVVGTAVQTLNLKGACLFVRGQSGSFEISATQGMFSAPDKQEQLLVLISQRSSRIEFPNSASTVDPDVAFVIPLVAVEKEVGILCLSQKLSKQDFSPDDVYLLEGFASVGAIALRSAMLVRDVSIRDTFVSVASHELRTPLTAVVGYADLLLRRDAPDATRKRWLKNILDNGQRISKMVDDLLNVTRIQSSKVSLKLERLKLSDVIGEQFAIIKESTSEHEFVVDVEPDLPEVFADRDKLGQVVGNLLSNAVKYSPNGGRITLSARNDLQRHSAVVSVADHGMGISPEDKALLFKTFHRIQRPETQGIRGSGLGLYIVKEWTEAMGGEVWLESELNKGSTFFVAIPNDNANTQGSDTAGHEYDLV